MITQDDLKEIGIALNSLPMFSPPEPGDYAELADENDEAGAVLLRRKNGFIFMSMPRDVWDSIR